MYLPHTVMDIIEQLFFNICNIQALEKPSVKKLVIVILVKVKNGQINKLVNYQLR